MGVTPPEFGYDYKRMRWACQAKKQGKSEKTDLQGFKNLAGL